MPMDFQTVAAQCFGFCAIVSIVLAYQQTDRKKLLIKKLSDDICWAMYYLLLGGVGGMITSTVGIFREIVFYQRGKSKFFSSAWIPAFFFALNWVIGILLLFMKEDNGWLQFLPVASSSLITVSLWVKKPKLTKLISLPVLFVFLGYNTVLTVVYGIPSYLGIVNAVLGIASILISFIRDAKNKPKPMPAP